MKNRDNPEQNSRTDKLLIEESNILKIAVAQMNVHVFVYDIPLKKLYFFTNHSRPLGVLEGSEYTIQEIVDSGAIDPEYIAVFELLFADIACGSKDADGLIKLCIDESVEDVWNHVMLINYFNQDGRPIRAIGTIQDVSKRVATELRYTQEKQYRLAMMTDSRRVYEINVTKDRFIKLESIQDSTDCGCWNVYSETMRVLLEKNVYREDWESFLQIAKRENLLQGFCQGMTEFYCEYRFVDENGGISWASSATHLLKDPISDDVKGFIYVKDIDKQKRLELELYQQAEHDSLTGIFNRRTAERSIEQILAASDETQLHGFLMIDFDDFKLVNDNFGHAKGDFLLTEMARRVSKIVDKKGIFARMGGDEFLVFLKNADSPEQVVQTAYCICSEIHNICIEEGNCYRPTVSVGIALYSRHGTTFNELYQNSDTSLYVVKANGKNQVSVFCDK